MEDSYLSVGCVHLLTLSRESGITPKGGFDTRNKLFVVIGVGKNGDIYGGVVFNSRVNLRLPEYVQRYQIPIPCARYPVFLSHNSFIDCSSIMRVKAKQLSIDTLRGRLLDEDTDLVIGAISEKANINIKEESLIEFGLIDHSPHHPE